MYVPKVGPLSSYDACAILIDVFRTCNTLMASWAFGDHVNSCRGCLDPVFNEDISFTTCTNMHFLLSPFKAYLISDKFEGELLSTSFIRDVRKLNMRMWDT